MAGIQRLNQMRAKVLDRVAIHGPNQACRLCWRLLAQMGGTHGLVRVTGRNALVDLDDRFHMPDSWLVPGRECDRVLIRWRFLLRYMDSPGTMDSSP